MFDWLYSLRYAPAVPRGRRGNPSAQSALVQTLEPRQMLTLLTSDGGEMVGDGSNHISYFYQTDQQYMEQVWDTYDIRTNVLGNISQIAGYPGQVALYINSNTEDTFRDSLRIEPRSESQFHQEDAGDRAYVRITAEARDTFNYYEGTPERWEYHLQVGGNSLVIDQDSINGVAIHVLQDHIGNSIDVSTFFLMTPQPDTAYAALLESSALVQSFTLDAAPTLRWSTTAEGTPSLDLFVNIQRSNFDSDVHHPWEPIDGTWDRELEQLTDPGLVAGTKIKLVWSTTTTPAGAVADAYELTLGEREVDGYTLVTGFQISPGALAAAPASARYLVAMVDTEDQLWESDEANNYDAVEPPTFITEVKAEFDDAAGNSAFGTYLAGVPLDTTFTVKSFDPSRVGQSVRYTITKPDSSKVEGTAAATSTPGQYQFKYDVGKLPAGTLPVKFELLNGTGAPVGEPWEGTIVVTDQLQVDFKGAADGKAMNRLDKLRFIEEIGVITDFETSVTTLPLFDQYKDKFDLVLRDSSSKAEVMRKPITFQKSGNFILARTENWDTTNLLDNSREGAEYEAVLSARQKHATTFDREVLNVENLPKWLTGAVAGKPNKFEDGKFVIHASFPPQLVNVPLPVPDIPFGLFKNAQSYLAAGLEFEVRAGLVATDIVTVRPTELKASVKLLGKDVFTSKPFVIAPSTPIELSNKVKLTQAAAITLGGKFVFAENVKLFDTSIGESKDFSITKTILSKLGGPATGLLDLNTRAEGKLEEFSGKAQFRITGIDGNDPQFDSAESYFQISAKAKASADVSVGASLKLNDIVIAGAGIEGTAWVKVEGKAAISFSGSVLTPSTNTVKYDANRTRLAAQFGADIKLTAQWLNNPPVVNEVFNPKSQVYTLFGNDSVQLSLQKPDSFEQAGDGIVTTAVARHAGFTSASSTAALSVSTLAFKDSLNGNTGRIQLDYDITSTIKPLATGRHRLEVVAVPFDTTVTETVLGTVDLATLTLTADPQGGFRSAAQSLILNLPPDQLDPRLNQRLVLRLISDPAGGETVRLRPSSINVTVSEPTLNMTAPNGILNDGAIVFGAETGGATAVNLQLTNTAGPMLLIDDLRVEGTNLRVNPLDELELYGNDLPTSITVDVINPALAASGTLRFKTNDPTRPEVSIPLSFVPSNTVPTIGGLPANQMVNDNTTISPLAAITVTDPNNQNMLAKVTILNGTVRGDFTTASTTGWTRSVSGNNIVYSRFYNPQANIGGVVQAALRGFVFVPRSNAIKPNTTELTDIQVFVNDGVANTTATTRLTTTSVNNAPSFGGTTANVAVNDNATVNPFTALTVSDVDMQEMLISVTILNGTVRGDFTAASTAGWAVRYVLGNNITYKRYFSPQANVGAAAQAAFRALVFQPRQNAIKPGTTEATDFQVTVSDGVAPAVLGTGTRVTTTSVNNAPTIGGAVAGQPMNDNQTKAVFSTLTVTDPDTQAMNVIITIPNGVNRGDFTAGSTTGWTRTVVGVDLRYNRFFSATANIGTTVQTAIRALVFQPRTNVPVGMTETTSFTVFLNDGLANTTNNTTSVITTGVAPRVATTAELLILPQDTTNIVLPTIAKPRTDLLARLLRKSR